MWNKPNHAAKKGGGVRGIIHEDPDQAIQGGSSGQHYHLTLSEWEKAKSDIVVVDSDIVISDGEVVYA